MAALSVQNKTKKQSYRERYCQQIKESKTIVPSTKQDMVILYHQREDQDNDIQQQCPFGPAVWRRILESRTERYCSKELSVPYKMSLEN